MENRMMGNSPPQRDKVMIECMWTTVRNSECAIGADNISKATPPCSLETKVGTLIVKH